MAHSIETLEPSVDVIIPIPMHWFRYWRRGFNQAYELARPIARRLSIEIQAPYLRRIRHTAEQAGIAHAKRLSNVRTAFKAEPAVKDLRIALVDDVVTTGATITACADTLLKAGARSVTVWGCARTLGDVKT